MPKKRGPMPFTILDEHGSVVEGQLAIYKPRGPVLVDWIRMFEQGLIRVLQADLNGEDLKMLIFLLTQVDFQNRVVVDTGLCYMLTNIQPKNHSRPLRRLEVKSLIKRADKIANGTVWKLNPLLAWKGNARTYPEAVKAFEPGFDDVELMKSLGF